MEEVAEVARAAGVALPSDAVERTMNFADRMPENSTSSMQRDLAAEWLVSLRLRQVQLCGQRTKWV